MTKVRFILIIIVLGAIVIFSGGVTSAHAINCGDTLGPGGNFQLQQDLDCSGTLSRAVTVKDGAILDLNGHIVTCLNLGPCVALVGIGAQLLDGAVRGALHENLHIEGTGHTVKNVTSGGADLNVLVIGDNNRLINVMASSAFNPAFIISGNNNQLSDSIAQCFNLFFAPGCIRVSGDSNRVIDNYVGFSQSNFGLAIPSLLISGNYNVVRRNRTISGDGEGILVTGTGNDIRHNTALNNSPFDLRDTNGDCVHNTWKFNTFDTADPACIQ